MTRKRNWKTEQGGLLKRSFRNSLYSVPPKEESTE